MNFTYSTIIGRDPLLLEGHLHNITSYAGFDKLPCEKKLLVIVYKNSSISSSTTDKILEICDKYGAQAELYEEPTSNFIENLYACWNLGYEKALDGFVFRGGSDQVFSRNSFPYLYIAALNLKDDNIVLQANTIENADRNLNSRHMLASLGNSFEDFSFDKFESFCKQLNENIPNNLLSIEDSMHHWGKPTEFTSSLGIINRTDGCSWLMKKKDWELHGPLPVIENGITGDVIIHDRLQQAGYKSYIFRDCVTYHFVRGESLNIQ